MSELSSVTTVTMVLSVVDPRYAVAADEKGPVVGGFPLMGMLGDSAYSMPAPSMKGAVLVVYTPGADASSA